MENYNAPQLFTASSTFPWKCCIFIDRWGQRQGHAVTFVLCFASAENRFSKGIEGEFDLQLFSMTFNMLLCAFNWGRNKSEFVFMPAAASLATIRFVSVMMHFLLTRKSLIFLRTIIKRAAQCRIIFLFCWFYIKKCFMNPSIKKTATRLDASRVFVSTVKKFKCVL